MYFSVFVSVALCASSAISHSPIAYQFDPLRHLSAAAQPFDPLNLPSDPAPPQGCNVTRAAYLVRHAAIYANDYDYDTYIEPFVQKLSNKTVDWSKIPDLAFLSTWRNPISDPEIEMLTRDGKLEATKLGVQVAQKYPMFRTPEKIWTSTAERTRKSAKAFAGGNALDNSSDLDIVQVYEGEEEGADSLTPYESCPAYSSSAGNDQSEQYLAVYTKAPIARFNSQAPIFNFTAYDIFAMSLLCGYETVIRGSSPFCSLSLLTPQDWLGWEYTNDITYHYNTGYGSPVSGAIGFPWVNATFNTLMSTQDDMSNATSQQDLYVSFTHRELPPTVLVALGLFNNSAYSGANNINETMPLNTINHNRAWKSSNILQFLTHIAIEKMECDSFGFESGVYYRVLVNESPQPLPGCTNGPGESCAGFGMSGWVVGRYGEICGVDYGNSTDFLSIYQ